MPREGCFGLMRLTMVARISHLPVVIKSQTKQTAKQCQKTKTKPFKNCACPDSYFFHRCCLPPASRPSPSPPPTIPPNDFRAKMKRRSQAVGGSSPRGAAAAAPGHRAGETQQKSWQHGPVPWSLLTQVLLVQGERLHSFS